MWDMGLASGLFSEKPHGNDMQEAGIQCWGPLSSPAILLPTEEPPAPVRCVSERSRGEAGEVLKACEEVEA